MTAHAQPPEARLIREKREQIVPALSMTRAAAAATADGLGNFSATLWTSIENGYQQTSQGAVPYSGTPDRVARMARVVGVTARELEQAGRKDAARTLAKLPAPRQRDARASLAERVERLEHMLGVRLEGTEDEEGEHRERRRA